MRLSTDPATVLVPAQAYFEAVAPEAYRFVGWDEKGAVPTAAQMAELFLKETRRMAEALRLSPNPIHYVGKRYRSDGTVVSVRPGEY